jgi:hypothetical protein
MNTEQKTVELTKTRDQLDQLAWLLDNCFKIPGTKWRVILSAAFSGYSF